jgi:hypothetical protein
VYVVFSPGLPRHAIFLKNKKYFTTGGKPGAYSVNEK